MVLETDKVAVEVRSPSAGTLQEILAQVREWRGANEEGGGGRGA